MDTNGSQKFRGLDSPVRSNEEQERREPQSTVSFVSLSSRQSASPASPAPLPSTNEIHTSGVITSIKEYFQSLQQDASYKLLLTQLGAVLVVASLVSLCLMHATNALLEGSGIETTIRGFAGFVVLALVAIGGHLNASTKTGFLSDATQSSVTLDLSLTALTAILLVSVANFVIVRRLGPKAAPTCPGNKSYWHAFGNALLIAAALGFVALVATASLSLNGMLRIELSASPISVFATVLVTVFGSSWLALRTTPQTTNPPVQQAVREGVAFTGFGLAVFGMLSVVTLVVIQNTSDIDDFSGIAALGVATLGALTVYLMGLGFFGALGTYTEGLGGDLPFGLNNVLPTSLDIWDIFHDSFAWPILFTVFLSLFLALRLGVQRGRTAQRFNRDRVWQLPVLTLLIWMVFTWLSSVRVSGQASLFGGSSSGGVTLEIGLAWYSCIMVALSAWIVSALAEFLPGFAYQITPKILVLVAGKKSVDQWVSGQGGLATSPSHERTTAPVFSHDVPTTTIAEAVTPSSVTQVPAKSPANKTHEIAAAPESNFLAPKLPSMTAKTKKKLRAAGILTASIAVLFGLGYGTVAYLNSTRKPEAQVEDYLKLLQVGQASDATAMVDPGISNDDRTLLTNEVLNKATSRLEFISAQTLSKVDGIARVEATYAINGERFTWNVDVKSINKEFGLLDNWKLATPLLGIVSFSSESEEILVAGTTLNLPEQEPQTWGEEATQYIGSFSAYPGSYSIESEPSKYYAAETKNVVVAGDSYSEDPIKLEFGTTDAFDQAIVEKINAFARKCVDIPNNMAANCPQELRNDELASLSLVTPAESISHLHTYAYTSDEVTWLYRENGGSEESVTGRINAEVSWRDDEPVVDSFYVN